MRASWLFALALACVWVATLGCGGTPPAPSAQVQPTPPPPPPTISSISPTSAIEILGATFRPIPLTVNGAEFVPGSTINLAGKPLSTTFVSSIQLTAVISDTDVSPTIRTYAVTVVNPSGAISNSVDFTLETLV
jgi:hypothetical protein